VLSMRVVAPETAIADPCTTHNQPLNLELLGLAIATAVAIFGIGLAYRARLARLDDGVPHDTVVALYAMQSPSDLEPVLTMYDTADERKAVARALFDRTTSLPRLDHVGALADVKMPAAVIRGNRRLVQLNSKLVVHADRDVPVLSRADLVAVKPRLAVRSVAEFTSQFVQSVA